MFKKVLRDFFIVFGLIALSFSTSQSFMMFVWRVRDGDKWWQMNPMKGGNLAAISGITFLDKFNGEIGYIKNSHYSGLRKSVLYLDGDSYTWSLKDTNFTGISDYHFILRYNGGNYHLDTTKRNILVIAITEIWIRKYFGDLRMLNEVYDSTKKDVRSARLYLLPKQTDKRTTAFIGNFSVDDLFNKNINQNLQCNLTNYNFMLRIFQYKAAINYYMFKRASGDVAISRDGEYLFMKASFSKNDSGSSLAPVSPKEIDHIVDNLNVIYDHYKAEGFNEIYLTMIPSTVSIIEPEEYNQLIPGIQNDKKLKMKIIDAYFTFKENPRPYFYHGDTHWNTRGEQLWVDKVNTILTNNDSL